MVKSGNHKARHLSGKEKLKLFFLATAFLMIVFCGVTKLSFIPYHFKGGYAETHLPDGMPPFERLYYLSIGIRNELIMQSMLAYSTLYDALFLDIKPYHPPETIRVFVIDSVPRGKTPKFQTFTDWEGDKFAEASEWVMPGEVAFSIQGEEKNQYGVPMFWRSGWEELSALDDNHDDIIDKRDVGFSKLAMMDKMLRMEGTTFVTKPLWIGFSGEYDTIDLKKRQIRSALGDMRWHPFNLLEMRTKKTRSIYLLDKITRYNPVVLQKPELSGYGYIPNLQLAMFEDPMLFQMVDNFSYCNPMDVFSNPVKTRGDIENILYRWAGVDGVPIRSRGPFIDGRQMEFIEKMMAKDFLQIGKWRNPRYFAAQDLKRLWNVLYVHYSTRLIFQSCGKVFFNKGAYYTSSYDAIVAKAGVNQKIVSDYMLAVRKLPLEKQQLFYFGLRDFITRAPSVISLEDMLYLMQQNVGQSVSGGP